MKLTAIIIDDEPLARKLLTEFSEKVPFLEVLDTFSNGIEALKYLKQHSPDLIFLDIQMPEIDGLALAATFNDNIKYVFCTAYEEHAVEAFSLNAFDYLVKPVEPKRLAQTLEKLRIMIEMEKTKVQKTYLPDSHGLLLKVGQSKKIIRLKHIERFESMGNYVAVSTANDQAYIHTSLKKVEQKLDPNVFFKVSRSVILRVDSINRIEEGFATGSLIAVLNSGHEVEVSRRQANVLKNLFNIWN